MSEMPVAAVNGIKTTLVIVAVVGMLVGAIGLTVGIVEKGTFSTATSLANNASKKAQYILERQIDVEQDVAVLQTQYSEILRALERIEKKIEENGHQ